MILEPDADTEGYRAIERDRERERERQTRGQRHTEIPEGAQQQQ